MLLLVKLYFCYLFFCQGNYVAWQRNMLWPSGPLNSFFQVWLFPTMFQIMCCKFETYLILLNAFFIKTLITVHTTTNLSVSTPFILSEKLPTLYVFKAFWRAYYWQNNHASTSCLAPIGHNCTFTWWTWCKIWMHVTLRANKTLQLVV